MKIGLSAEFAHGGQFCARSNSTNLLVTMDRSAKRPLARPHFVHATLSVLRKTHYDCLTVIEIGAGENEKKEFVNNVIGFIRE
jgi:hypothetical protein